MVPQSLRRVVLVGEELDEVRPEIERHGFVIVDAEPDLVISHGGDGTLIGAERDWPGVPKLAIQRASICKRCPNHETDVVLAAVAAGEHSINEYLKVEATARDWSLVGLNEVLVHNAVVTSAVRFIVKVDGVALAHEIVGDGLVFATPFGSSGYFRSITNSTFQTGLGLAFNNTTEPIDHIILHREVEVLVRVTRGPGLLAADNNPETFALERGHEVVMRRHPHPAVILNIDTLSCPRCKRVREAEGAQEHVQVRPDHRGALLRP